MIPEEKRLFWLKQMIDKPKIKKKKYERLFWLKDVLFPTPFKCHELESKETKTAVSITRELSPIYKKVGLDQDFCYFLPMI